MLHQIYILKQMNVCRDYNGNRGEQKHNVKFHQFVYLLHVAVTRSFSDGSAKRYVLPVL